PHYLRWRAIVGQRIGDFFRGARVNLWPESRPSLLTGPLAGCYNRGGSGISRHGSTLSLATDGVMSALPAPRSRLVPPSPGWTPRLICPSSRHGLAARICARVFLVWLVLRTLIWTLVASLRPNPSAELVEWLCWA